MKERTVRRYGGCASIPMLCCDALCLRVIFGPPWLYDRKPVWIDSQVPKACKHIREQNYPETTEKSTPVAQAQTVTFEASMIRLDPSEDLCPSESSKLLRDCCIGPDNTFRTRPVDTHPPAPQTGFSNPWCYASRL